MKILLILLICVPCYASNLEFEQVAEFDDDAMVVLNNRTRRINRSLAGKVGSLADLDVTATATELNNLDGYTGSVANFNTLVDTSNADALHTHGTAGLDANSVSGAKMKYRLAGNLTGTGGGTPMPHYLTMAAEEMIGYVVVNANPNLETTVVLSIDTSGNLEAKIDTTASANFVGDIDVYVLSAT